MKEKKVNKQLHNLKNYLGIDEPEDSEIFFHYIKSIFNGLPFFAGVSCLTNPYMEALDQFCIP